MDEPAIVEVLSVLYDRNDPIRVQFDDPIPTHLHLGLYDDRFLESEATAITEVSPSEAMVIWDVRPASGYNALAAFTRWEGRGDASYYFGLILP